MLAPRAPVIIHETFGVIITIRDLGDLAPQHGFGVIHQLLGGLFDSAATIGIHQFAIAFDAQFSGGNLRLKVAHHQPRHPGVARNIAPERVIALARLDQLKPVQKHAFGKHIRHVDDQARRGRADIEVVRRVGRKAHKITPVKDRHDDADVRRMAGTVIGVVVDHHIPLAPV